MLTIGDRFPAYRLKGVVSNDVAEAFQDFDEHSAVAIAGVLDGEGALVPTSSNPTSEMIE